MRVTLLHKPTAGEGSHSRDDLVALFEGEGHAVTYQSLDEDWSSVLDEPADWVVAAGGDGTLATVATRLAGLGMPLAILALGTANNIATQLGGCGRPEDIVPRLRAAERRPLDLGVARGPWGERRFVEGVGLGAFAVTVAFGSAEKGTLLPDLTSRDDALEQDLRLLRAVLRNAETRPYTVVLDGHEETHDALLVEVRNIGLTGPNVVLAPGADSGDGLFDVVVAAEEDREVLVHHLSARIEGREPPPLALPVCRAHTMRLISDPVRVHVDGSSWPSSEEPLAPGEPVEIDVSVEPSALEVLVPV